MIKPMIAHAHCDVPCGIYEPTVAKIAARTVARMTDQLEELAPPDWKDAHAVNAHHNAVTRRITVKEAHAETVKRELETLWSDFFKPEHLEKFPDLHDQFWKAIKLASTCKQEISQDHAADLLQAVDEIATMFYEVKGVPERYAAYQEITDNLYK